MAPFVARIVPAHKVGKAMAIVFSGNSLGLAIGAPLGTALGGLIGWRASFLLLAGTGVVLAAPGHVAASRRAGGSRTRRGHHCARRSASPE